MKFYSSMSNADIGQLTNTWGDFNKLINYFIDGGNPVEIMRIEPHGENRIKIYYDDSLTDIPWVLNTVVTVTGSTVTTFNSDFFLENINAASKFYIAYNSTLGTSNTVDTSANITARTTPSGITRVFGGVTEKRTVIKFDDGDNNDIQYRIDDRDWSQLIVPAVPWNPNYVKTARISMSQSYDNLDFTSERIYPYNADRPSENFAPHGAYIGQCIIPYSITAETQSYISQTNIQQGNVHWRAYASEKMLIVQMFPLGYFANQSYNIIIGTINRVIKNKKNGIMVCKRMNNLAWNSTVNNLGVAAAANQPHIFGILPGDRSNYSVVIYNDPVNNNIADVNMSGNAYIGSSPPSAAGTNKVPFPLNGDYKLFTSDVLISNGAYVPYGTLYDVKWILSSYAPGRDELVIVDGIYHIAIKSIASTEVATALIKMDIP